MDKANQLRFDKQLTGMAGEFLVAGKLSKRWLQVSITMGNAKAIDLFVHNPRTDRTTNVQVKTLRQKNCFPMQREKVKASHVYVFVILNRDDKDEQFFIVPGEIILQDINYFLGASYNREKPSIFPAVNYGHLKDFEGNWELFEI